jgi:hypothetical protein
MVREMRTLGLLLHPMSRGEERRQLWHHGIVCGHPEALNTADFW